MKFFWMVQFLAFVVCAVSWGISQNTNPDWLRIADAGIAAFNFWAMIMNTIWWLDSVTVEE